MEAAPPHSGRVGRDFHAGSGRFHLQCAALSALARAAADHSPAQLQGIAGARSDQRPASRAAQDRPQALRDSLQHGEGLRAAYYVPYDPASYSSFKEHVHQIDLLFPGVAACGRSSGNAAGMSSDNHREYAVIEGNTVHDPDEMNKIKRVIQASKEDTEIFPHLNNFNPNTQSWDPAIANVLGDHDKSAAAAPADFALSLPPFRPIAASRWTSKTCPTKPARRM
jgi:hypothetical protein